MTGTPRPVEERPEKPWLKEGEPICGRCDEKENRIKGFCSVYCKDMDEEEREKAALLAVVREPYQPTFDEVMSHYTEADDVNGYTVGLVVGTIRKLIRKNALDALPEHLK